MTTVFKNSWTEADVMALLGQSESIRCEFKAGTMFDREPESKWVETLSKEVSALANTEGGELILGVDEDKKSKPRLAVRVDGIPTTVAPERLQQLIEGNVSPYLPGMRVQRVRLSAFDDRVVYVVQVPQGTTAYQVNDGRYYGRSEFGVNYLRDHEVRLRMSRGRVARAAVILRLKGIQLGSALEAKRLVEIEQAKREIRTQHAPAIEAFKTGPEGAMQRHGLELLDANLALEHLNAQAAETLDCQDEISFDLVLRNDGELTIRDPTIQIDERRPDGILDGVPLAQRLDLSNHVIYPGEEREIAGSHCHLRCRREAILATGDYLIGWTVFLDNSPPSRGEIDLGSELETARREHA